MAEQQWEIVIRDNASEADLSLGIVPARTLKRLVEMLYIDLGAHDQLAYQFPAILRLVPDPAEAERVVAARRELNRLSAEAGQRIQRQLRDERQIP